jgi:hypothetical protein
MKVKPGKYSSLKVKGRGCSFIGEYERSPNGRYTISWVDGHITIAGGSEADGRQNMPGKFLLLDRNREVVRGAMERPNNGHVADNGTFVLCDWTFARNNAIFYVADRSGKLILERKFGKLTNCGISPDGRFACCHAVDSDHDNVQKLHFFDLTTGKLLWAKEPETGSFSKSYRFDSKKGLLYLVYRDWGPLAYSFAGEFLDAQKWRQRQMELGEVLETGATGEAMEAGTARGTDEFDEFMEGGEVFEPDQPGGAIEDNETIALIGVTDIGASTETSNGVHPPYVADEDIRALEKISDTSARQSRGQEIFDLLQQAWRKADDPITQARICQSLGELFEVLDLREKAIRCYEQALAYDESASVKPRLDLLKRSV